MQHLPMLQRQFLILILSKKNREAYPKVWDASKKEDFFFFGPGQKAWCVFEGCRAKPMKRETRTLKRHVETFHLSEQKKNKGTGPKNDATSTEGLIVTVPASVSPTSSQ